MNKWWKLWKRIEHWLAVTILFSASVGAFMLYLFADELGMVRGHPDAFNLPEAPECHDPWGRC